MVKVYAPPKWKCWRFFYYISNSKAFEIFITICILLNTVIMALKYHKMSSEFEKSLNYLNYFFSLIFNLEAAIKILGCGISYFKNSWNQFDFLIVIGTDIGFIFEIISFGNKISTSVTVFWAFWILRLMKLLWKFGWVIIGSLIYIIPSIQNIVILIFLLIFIFAALGNQIFAEIMYWDNYDRYANFWTFPQSILILMRISTGEDWNLLLGDLINKEPYNGIVCRD